MKKPVVGVTNRVVKFIVRIEEGVPPCYEVEKYGVWRDGTYRDYTEGEMQLILQTSPDAFVNVALHMGKVVCKKGKMVDYPIYLKGYGYIINAHTRVCIATPDADTCLLLRAEGVTERRSLSNLEGLSIANKVVYTKNGKKFLRNKREVLDLEGLIKLKPIRLQERGKVSVNTVEPPKLKVIEGGQLAKAEKRELEFVDEVMGEACEWKVKLRRAGEEDMVNGNVIKADTFEIYKKNIKGRWQMVASYFVRNIKYCEGGLRMAEGVVMSKAGVQKIQGMV